MNIINDQPDNPTFKTKLEGSLASVLLMTFTLGISFLCVVVLAATLTQARISSLAIEGVNLSIWKLDTVRQDWTAIRDQQKAQSKALGAAEVERTATTKKKAQSEAQYIAARNVLDSELEEFNFRLRPFDATLASNISGQSLPEQIGRIQATRQSLDSHLELKPYLDKLPELYSKYRITLETRNANRASDDAIQNQITSLKDDLKKVKESIGAVFSTLKSNLDEAGRTRIENALYELQPTASLLSVLNNKLVTAHPDVLTLFLVILMGILGSALQITHAFFNENRSDGVGSYLLRVCVGAITALVIFIVAKAGVPVIADASKLGGDAPINPYFVSFLAILSGLLSENAIVFVQGQGAKFFGTGSAGNIIRWARTDLNQRFNETGSSLEKLSQLMGISQEVTKSILSGKMSATADQQKDVSLYLRDDIRNLFSDLPGDTDTAPAKAPD